MTDPTNTPNASKWATAAAFAVALAFAATGCLVTRQSGAHDIYVEVYGDRNSFVTHTERDASGQSAAAAPTLDVKPDVTVPLVP